MERSWAACFPLLASFLGLNATKVTGQKLFSCRDSHNRMISTRHLAIDSVVSVGGVAGGCDPFISLSKLGSPILRPSAQGDLTRLVRQDTAGFAQ